jgi:hypothetical protein
MPSAFAIRLMAQAFELIRGWRSQYFTALHDTFARWAKAFCDSLAALRCVCNSAPVMDCRATSAVPARPAFCTHWNKTLRPPFLTVARVPCTKCSTSRPSADCEGCALPFGCGGACCPHHKTPPRHFDKPAQKFAPDSLGRFRCRRGQVRAFGFLSIIA